jgi:hypothetical protein
MILHPTVQIVKGLLPGSDITHTYRCQRKDAEYTESDIHRGWVLQTISRRLRRLQYRRQDVAQAGQSDSTKIWTRRSFSKSTNR